eukprot:jgi/Chlat1/7651/Chrsp64S09158
MGVAGQPRRSSWWAAVRDGLTRSWPGRLALVAAAAAAGLYGSFLLLRMATNAVIAVAAAAPLLSKTGLGLGALIAAREAHKRRRRLVLALRRARIFSAAAIVFAQYKTVEWRTSRLPDNSPQSDALWQATHARAARRVYKAAAALEGVWVKAGQYMSTRADVLPPTWLKELKGLQDTLPPRPLQEVEETITHSLGAPTSLLFASFDPIPLGTASIAQVHRARLHDGTDAVVKVQHRGVRDKIMQDLRDLQILVRAIARVFPDYNLSPLVDEWCAEVPKELDFNIEAENTRRVARELKEGSGAFALDVVVPRIIESTDCVLIMDYIDGLRLNNRGVLLEAGVDTQALVTDITKAYAHQIYVSGFYNGDPHAGNFLVSIDKDSKQQKAVLLDFGLTKTLDEPTKVALAKMLLAAYEKDLAALLSSFQEMGLKLKIDLPEESMKFIQFFFRTTAPAKEAKADTAKWRKEFAEDKEKARINIKDEKEESLRRNPVDAFPGALVFFMRVLNLLRGVSASLDARVSYLDVMRPFAEATLRSAGALANGAQLSFYAGPLSRTEEKLHALLTDLHAAGQILGVQVAVYEKGELVINTAAGVHGKYDPRPVMPDTLFNVFSVTKAVTSVLAHKLVEQGLFTYDTPIASVWPAFAASNKSNITVAHALSHAAGLASAGAEELKQNPLSMSDWQAMLRAVADASPQHAPGAETQYHALSFGWIVGGLLEELITKPLGIESEMYVGVPPGVESRFATLAAQERSPAVDLPAEQLSEATTAADSRRAALAQRMREVQEAADSSSANLLLLFNTLMVRRAPVPAANGHMSARALAKFYSSCSSLFRNQQDAQDAFRAKGKYARHVDASSSFGLGFRRYSGGGFGHGGVGGSLGYYDPARQLAIGITVNSLSMEASATAAIMRLLCAEFGAEVPEDFVNKGQAAVDMRVQSVQ